MSERRDISSNDYTFFHKIVLPAMAGLGAIIGTTVGIFNIRGDLRFVIIFWPAIAAWIFWAANRLKWVSIDKNFIYAAGIRKEIRVLLTEVDRVEVSYMQNPKQITLWLKSPTEFGRKIVFVPQQRFFDSMREGHPLADELKAMIEAQANGYKQSRT